MIPFGGSSRPTDRGFGPGLFYSYGSPSGYILQDTRRQRADCLPSVSNLLRHFLNSLA